jgi:SAM-dependent methyltransferase
MFTRAEALGLFDVLADLYRQELADEPTAYLLEHSRPPVILHQVNVFAWYSEHLPPAGRVLDWGCNHGPDLCLLRSAFGDRYELHGADFAPADAYPAFRRYAGAVYQHLTDPLQLPFPPNHFDAVIASGVLEHVAMESESLKQLHRILRPGGLLVISYLPYRWSVSEAYRRWVLKKDFHRKRFDLGQLNRLLMSCGFLPDEIRTQGFVPHLFSIWHEKRGVEATLRRAASVVRQAITPAFQHSVVCALARKRVAF